jgi:hypothetical protein
MATTLHKRISATLDIWFPCQLLSSFGRTYRLTVPKILKKVDGISVPIVIELIDHTPIGKVKPHQPMLKWKGLLLYMLASAKINQTSPQLHMISAMKNPRT